MTPILEVKELCKSFPGTKALDRVQFDLVEGEVHAICGENGAGKSTLIKILSGLWRRGTYEGELRLNGKVVSFQSIRDAEEHGIAVIYQELALVEDMSVAENVFLGHEPTQYGIIDWNQMFQKTQELIEHFKIDLNPDHKIHSLGVGKKQLVEILKALKKESKILILDEPTAALTEREVAILLEIVKEIKGQGITCIYISHRLDEVFEISDRITVLRDGRSIQTYNTLECTKNTIIEAMVGREIDDLFPYEKSETGEEKLRVKNLGVVDDAGHVILRNIHFSLNAGEVLGIGGLMGAGRSELLMHLMGCFGKRSSGEVFVNERDVQIHSAEKAIALKLALVSEDRKRYGLNLDESNSFNMSLSSFSKFIKSTHSIDELEEVQRNQRISESLKIKAPSIEAVSGTLSGGNQQKVVIAKALLTEPEIILLDEPTRGIDVGAKLEVYELINQLKKQGKAVLLVSSELNELIGLSDRILILKEGEVASQFSRDEFDQNSLLAAAIGHEEEI